MKKIAQERSLLDKAYQALNLKGKITNKLDPEQKVLFDFINKIDEKSRLELISGMNGKSITKNLSDAFGFFEKDNYLKCGQHIISITNILLKVVEYQNMLQNQMNMANLPEFAKKRFLDNGGNLESLDSLRADAPNQMVKSAGLFDWFKTSNLYNLINKDRWKKLFKEKNSIIGNTENVLNSLNDEVKTIVKKFDELSGDLKRYDIMAYVTHSNELINQIKAVDEKVKTYVTRDFQPFVKQVLPPEVTKKFEEAVKEDNKLAEKILENAEPEKENEKSESVLDKEITTGDPEEVPSHESLKEPEISVPDDELEEELEQIVQKPVEEVAPINLPEEEVRESLLPEETVDQKKRRKFLEEKVHQHEEKQEEKKKKKKEEESNLSAKELGLGDLDDLGDLAEFFPSSGGKSKSTEEENFDLSEFDDSEDNFSIGDYQKKLDELKEIVGIIQGLPKPRKPTKEEIEFNERLKNVERSKVVEKQDKPVDANANINNAIRNGVSRIEKGVNELLGSRVPFNKVETCKAARNIVNFGVLNTLKSTIRNDFWKDNPSELYTKLQELITKLDDHMASLKKSASARAKFIKNASYENLIETTNKLIDQHKYTQASKTIQMTLPHLDKKDKRYVSCLNIMLELGR